MRRSRREPAGPEVEPAPRYSWAAGDGTVCFVVTNMAGLGRRLRAWRSCAVFSVRVFPWASRQAFSAAMLDFMTLL
jgi:hypothetical protein